MAITVDWSEKIIHVPRADMTLVQTVPIEIRQLDIDWFRLILKDIEDSVAGIVSQDMHQHFPTLTIGTLTIARSIEIINGFTITFEDGQYMVDVVGGNSNILDTVNPNNVSVRGNNSAGMAVPIIDDSDIHSGLDTYTNKDDYKADVSTLATTAQLDSLNDITSTEAANAVWGHTDALQLLLDVKFIKNIEGGRWHLVNNQMIFYGEDNVTEVARFNLFDKNNNPAEENVYHRRRV